jgi:putative ATP-dependent endonuclease of OLD family
LHDSDRRTYRRKKDGKECANPAWAINDSIRTEMTKASSATRLVASVPNFEAAYFGDEVETDKPYNALSSLKADSAILVTVSELLDALLDFAKPLPLGALEWANIDALTRAVDGK